MATRKEKFPFPIDANHEKIAVKVPTDFENDDLVVVGQSAELSAPGAGYIDGFVVVSDSHVIEPLRQTPMLFGPPGSDDELEELVECLEDMDRSTLLRHCTAFLVERKLYVADPTKRKYTHDTILDGFQILANCHDEWHENYKLEKGTWPLGNIMARIELCLSRIPEQWQFSLWRLLETLHGTFDWVDVDKNAVGVQDFEISATIWFLQMGPLGLALGWLHRRSCAELALAAKQAWKGDYSKSDEEHRVLEAFSKYMREWGRDMISKTCDEVDV